MGVSTRPEAAIIAEVEAIPKGLDTREVLSVGGTIGPIAEEGEGIAETRRRSVVKEIQAKCPAISHRSPQDIE